MVAITAPRLLPFDRPARLPDVIYRRRRLLALGVALVLAALVLAAVTSFQATAGFRGEPAATVTYVVEPGDTVWSIATALAPDADPRPLVDAIVEANGGAGLDVGERLVLELP